MILFCFLQRNSQLYRYRLVRRLAWSCGISCSSQSASVLFGHSSRVRYVVRPDTAFSPCAGHPNCARPAAAAQVQGLRIPTVSATGLLGIECSGIVGCGFARNMCAPCCCGGARRGGWGVVHSRLGRGSWEGLEIGMEGPVGPPMSTPRGVQSFAPWHVQGLGGQGDFGVGSGPGAVRRPGCPGRTCSVMGRQARSHLLSCLPTHCMCAGCMTRSEATALNRTFAHVGLAADHGQAVFLGGAALPADGCPRRLRA
jgi:hypothetical protein